MSEKKLVMRAFQAKIETYKEVTDGTTRTACCGERAETGCTCKPAPDAGSKDNLSPEILAQWKGLITAEWPQLTSEVMEGWAVSMVRDLAAKAACQAADRVVKARALSERLKTIPPRAAETIRRELNLDALSELPPAVRAAAQQFGRDVEAVEQHGALGAMTARVSYAALRTEATREEMKSGASRDRQEEAEFQAARGELGSPFKFVRQLAEGRIRRLAAGGHKGREELIRSIRAGSSAAQVEGLPLDDVPDHLLRDLAADKPLALGLVKRAAQDAARERKRRR